MVFGSIFPLLRHRSQSAVVYLAILFACPHVLLAQDQVILRLEIEHYEQEVALASGGYALGSGGFQMIGGVSDQMNAVTLLIFGPIMYLCLAIGALVSVYGYLQGRREYLFTGMGVFIMAATLRALMPLFLDPGSEGIWFGDEPPEWGI